MRRPLRSPPLLPLFLLGLALRVSAPAPARAAIPAPQILPGYLRALPDEPALTRQLRHVRVAERRAGPALLAHRGACTLAPENTLEAYAAAMEYGADGCEVDIRRTVDDVLVMFHDDMLDRLTDGFGTVEHLSYSELLALQPQRVFGAATARTRPPTFIATLELARQRAMLLHLDVKQPGLDDEIARLLEAADVWDHVVALNTDTLPKLLRHPKVKLLRYKGAAYENRLDWDPATIRQVLAKPGQLLLLEDPRLAARELNRPKYTSSSSTLSSFHADWVYARAGGLSSTTNLVPSQYLRELEAKTSSIDDLLVLLRDDNLAARRQPASDPAAERQRTKRILERAWAAERLGHTAVKSPRLIERLEFQVRHPSWHRDWQFTGLDAHAAARALGRLGAVESVLVLWESVRHVDPDLARVRNPAWTNSPLAWVDWRRGSIISVLAELHSDDARRFLSEYVNLSEAQAREISIPQFEHATTGLLHYRLSRAELNPLLMHQNTAVRGTAILFCLDHPSPDRTAALRERAPWALALPRGPR